MESGAKEGGSAWMEREMWGVRATDWAEVQEDTVLPLYKEVLAKTGIGGGKSVLDVGCGSGRFCQMAAERGARVSGFDATPALLNIAKGRVPSGNFLDGDMESLPYPEDSFHVVTGFNSFQYASNPANALRQAGRVARKGSIVVMAVWGKAADCQAAAYLAAVGRFLPLPPPGHPGPFAYSDDGALEALARRAGLTPMGVYDVDCPWVYSDLETALRGLLSSGPVVRAIEISGEKGMREAVTGALEPFRSSSGAYRMENKFRYMMAYV